MSHNDTHCPFFELGGINIRVWVETPIIGATRRQKRGIFVGGVFQGGGMR
jgi:hypothetical protein